MAAYEEHPINARTLPRIIAEKIPNSWHIDQLHEALSDQRTGLMEFASCRVLDLYCYLRGSNRSHEFLLARILLDQSDVWARIEREPDTSARSALSGRAGFPAVDLVRLSNSDEKLKSPKDKLDVHCGFPSLRLYHLVDCAKLVHDETFNYEWNSTNCWWFSSIIVETLHVYGEYHKKPHSDMVKQLVNLFGKDTTDARRRIQEGFRGKWTDSSAMRSDMSTTRRAAGGLVRKFFRRTSSVGGLASDSASGSLLSSAPRLRLRLREENGGPVSSNGTVPVMLPSPQTSSPIPHNRPMSHSLPAGSQPISNPESELQASPVLGRPAVGPSAYADLPPDLERWAKKEPKVSKLNGHTEGIYCIDVASDRIVTGSRDTRIQVWSATSHALLATLRGHISSVLCLKAAATGDFLVSGSSDGELLIWNLETLQHTFPMHRISAHQENVLAVILSPDYIISSGRDKTVKVWSRETFRLLWSSVGHHHASVNALDISLESSRIVSASADKTLAPLALWEISSEGLSLTRTFTGHKRGVACVRFLPLSDQAQIPRSSSAKTPEELFASGSSDKSIRIWRANTGECVRALEGHTDLVRGLAYDPSVGLLMSGSHDNTIVFWQLRLLDYLFADSVQGHRHDPGSDEKLRVFKRYHNRIFGLGVNGHRIICVGSEHDAWIFDFS